MTKRFDSFNTKKLRPNHCPKKCKSPLSVDMRRSNTPFLKLPNFTQAQSIVNEEEGESLEMRR